MKGNRDKAMLSLIGLKTALWVDVGIVATEGAKFEIKLTEDVELTYWAMSRSRTAMDPPDAQLTSDGRVFTGSLPVLIGVGFKKEGDDIILTKGGHVMMAGNFTSVFYGPNCAEVAANYDAISRDRIVYMTVTKSAKGNLWMNFSVGDKKQNAQSVGEYTLI